MQESFSYTGYWWLPESPDLQIPGTLKYDSENGIILELMGVFSNMNIFDGRFHSTSILNGSLIQDAKDVTLWICQETKRTSFGNRKHVVSRYIAEFLFIGAHFLSEADLQFISLSGSYSNLEQWVNEHPFSLDDNAIDISGAGSIDKTIDLGEFIVKIWDHNILSPEINQVKLEHNAIVSIEFYKPVEFRFASRKLEHLQNFISLGVGKSTTTKTLNGKISNDSLDVEIFTLYRNFDSIQNTKKIHRQKMLFTLADLGDQFDTCIRNWYLSLEILEPIYDLFFAILDEPNLYLDIQYELLVRILEVYHRRTTANLYLTDEEFKLKVVEPLTRAIDELSDIEPDYKKELKGKIQYWNEQSLRKRLKDLIARLRRTLSSQISNFITDEKTFVNFIVTTRNELTHYSSKSDLPDPKTYVEYVRKLKVLILMCILTQIGLDSALIGKIIEKSEDYKLSTSQTWS